MNKKILIAVPIVVVIAIALQQTSIQNNGSYKKPVDQVYFQQSSTKDKVITKSSDKKTKLDERLIYLAAEIAPPSEKELQDNWQDEYGCYLLPNDCYYAMLNAKSLDEAIWMRRKGYPSMSSLAMLNQVSEADLLTLSKYGNNDANKLLAMDALYHNVADKARIYARSSIAHGHTKESFGYRLLAKSYLISQDQISASLNFKIASILGDSEALIEYRNITHGTAASVVDKHNKMAYGYLDAWIKTPISDWGNDPRPQEEGG